MTLDEANKIAMVCSQADGGCGPCVSSLVDCLAGAFPEFDWYFTGYDGEEDEKGRPGSGFWMQDAPMIRVERSRGVDES